MGLKKYFSAIVFLVGILMVGGSFYIKKQVAEGKIQVSDAERSVRQGKALFSLNPVSKQIGEGLTRSADRKIASAKDEIQYYTNLAQLLLVGGIVLIVVGAGMFVLKRKR